MLLFMNSELVSINMFFYKINLFTMNLNVLFMLATISSDKYRKLKSLIDPSNTVVKDLIIKCKVI